MQIELDFKNIIEKTNPYVVILNEYNKVLHQKNINRR